MGMTPQKKSKKKLVIILSIVLAILLIAGGIAGYFIYSSIQAEKEKQEKERKLQEAMLSVKKKFGKNAILKGSSLQEGSTTIERNNQIGGHRA